MKKKITAIIILVLILTVTSPFTAFVAALPNGFQPPERVLGYNEVYDGKTIRIEEWENCAGYYFDGCRVLDCNIASNIWRYEFHYTPPPELFEYQVQSEHFTVLRKDSGPVSGESKGQVTTSFHVTGSSSASFIVPEKNSYREVGDSMHMDFSFDLTINVLELGLHHRFSWYSATGTIRVSYSMSTQKDGTKSDDIVYTVNLLPEGNSLSLVNPTNENAYLRVSIIPENAKRNVWLTLGFDLIGVLPSNAKHAGIVTNASATGGEEGFTIPAAIVIGLLGGGAAAVGAAAAVSGDDERKKKTAKSYKMYVQKDFGDTLRRGGDPLVIRARMAEVMLDGTEYDRNDLTAKIGASSDGMTVHSTALSGRYFESTVSISESYNKEKASIIFTFIGEGGSFENTIVFRVVDGASLSFVEETDKADEFRLNDSTCYIDAIAGDGFTYTERFMIFDAVREPELADIFAEKVDGFDVSFEKTDRAGVYKINIKNNTCSMSKTDIFTKPEKKFVSFSVNVEGEKEKLFGSVYLYLYHEGLNVMSHDERKKNNVSYVYVQAFEKKEYGGLDNKWQISTIEFILAVKGKNKAVINPGNMVMKFDKLKGAGGMGTDESIENSVAVKYEYKENTKFDNGKYTYIFEPNATLCEPDDGKFFIVMLPASCEYKGEKYTADIPIRLRGVDSDPYEGWDEEYQKLKDRIEKFALPENRRNLLIKLDELATYPRASTAQLRLTSKYIVRQYMQYWTIEGIQHRTDAEIYDIMVSQLEWLKFFGDCAFSILVAAYAGPTAEALISPAKEFITAGIGEMYAQWNHGEEIDVDKFEFSKMLETAGDNLVGNQINVTNWRKAAITLSAYFVYAAFKNYSATLREKGESDLYGSLIKGFKDLTIQGLKTGAGKLFEKWIKNNSKFQEKVGKYIKDYLNQNLGKGRIFNMSDQKISNFQYDFNKKLEVDEGLVNLFKLKGAVKEVEITKIDILEKYITELLGNQSAEILDKVDDHPQFSFASNGHVIFTFIFEWDEDSKYTIRIDLMQVFRSINCFGFNIIYNAIFGEIPVASATLNEPKDPPLPPVKENILCDK